MKPDRRGELPAGYASGPGAATQATAMALARAAGARAVVLVEGVSDQIAVETLAGRRGRRLGAEGVTVVPVGGAHAIARYLRRFGPGGARASHAACVMPGRRTSSGGASRPPVSARPRSRADLERMGFHVCVRDLQEELIRAASAALAEELLGAQGDLGSFRTMQRQPAWRGKPREAQLRRFLGAGSIAAPLPRLLVTRSTSTACRSLSTPYSPPFNSGPRIPDHVVACPPESHKRTPGRPRGS